MKNKRSIAKQNRLKRATRVSLEKITKGNVQTFSVMRFYEEQRYILSSPVQIHQMGSPVKAGLTLEWSNGTTEGHVNRLKFLKCQMFGRAHLDLLRVKVLHAV